ncbi:MAG: hypothetical protein C4293_02410 [Nitrospiraceae bacterium]
MNPSVESREDMDMISLPHSGLGLLHLSSDGELLYMNRRGEELIREMNEGQSLKASGHLFPRVITAMCNEVRRLICARLNVKDWEQLEVQQIVKDSKGVLVLHGFGFRSKRTRREAGILIFLERIAPRETHPQQVMERFQLTEREQAILQNLLQGCTNKEIAFHLGISEGTVKSHIRHIMAKMKCSTRTAIVAQALHA